MKIFLVVGSVFLLSNSAFAQKTPDLYPNAYLQKAGPQQAQADINACRGQALGYESDNKEGVLRKGAKSAARGAARGALAGTIVNGKAGRGAGAGAALGGMSTAGNTIREKRDGSPEYRSYMSACLEEKGYRVVGWK